MSEHLPELHNLGNDIKSDGVPEGAVRVEAYIVRGQIVILGVPDEGDEFHNCDAMGCGCCHVIYRLPLPVTHNIRLKGLG
jgi:hypothetical protein